MSRSNREPTSSLQELARSQITRRCERIKGYGRKLSEAQRHSRRAEMLNVCSVFVYFNKLWLQMVSFDGSSWYSRRIETYIETLYLLLSGQNDAILPQKHHFQLQFSISRLTNRALPKLDRTLSQRFAPGKWSAASPVCVKNSAGAGEALELVC